MVLPKIYELRLGFSKSTLSSHTTAVFNKCTVAVYHKVVICFTTLFNDFYYLFSYKNHHHHHHHRRRHQNNINNKHLCTQRFKQILIWSENLKCCGSSFPSFIRKDLIFFFSGWQVGLSFLKYFYGVFCFLLYLLICLFVYLISFHLVADSSRRNREAINVPVFVIFCLC